MSIADELAAADPRPEASASRALKKNYGERLSRHLATKIACALRPAFPGITPADDGTLQEAPARTSKGYKKLDVNYSTRELGLGLGVSVKTLNYSDARSKRYTKNYSRIDNELRAEAMDYHMRQPYSVMVAVLFLPLDSCSDGAPVNPSSFGAAIKYFRDRGSRVNPRNEEDKFERMFVGTYVPDGPDRGMCWFVDVRDAPPRRGAPDEDARLSFDNLIVGIQAAYDERNDPPFEWGPLGVDP